ncbi:MAG: AAA family ATPase [Chloroflexia bacterium]
MLGHRIVVVGSSGSGKTTLARLLSRQLDLPHVELDALHWEPGWVEASLPAFRERVAASLSNDAWVVDGNYSRVRDISWPRADTIVWLDYSLPVILARLARRTFRRVFTQEELWNGNRESLRGAFIGRDSLFMWALTTYRRRRREYPQLLASPAYTHLHLVRLRSPRETARLLSRTDA